MKRINTPTAVGGKFVDGNGRASVLAYAPSDSIGGLVMD